MPDLPPHLGGKDMSKSAPPDEEVVAPVVVPNSPQMPAHWMKLHPRWWFFWHDCPFGMPGEQPMFHSTVLRPQVKAMVQCAIIEGHFTWEHLEVRHRYPHSTHAQHTSTQP